MLGPPSVLRALVRKEPRSEVLSALTTARVPARCWAGVAFGAFFLASSASMAALIGLFLFARRRAAEVLGMVSFPWGWGLGYRSERAQAKGESARSPPRSGTCPAASVAGRGAGRQGRGEPRARPGGRPRRRRPDGRPAT